MLFESFPKIPRLNREITVTEKIDGTNAAVLISDPVAVEIALRDETPHGTVGLAIDGAGYFVQCQSRNRLIGPNDADHPGADNHGFAAWVDENAGTLVRLLGPGRHFGEWWGQGVARNYGLDHKRFSLFNPDRYAHLPSADSDLDVWVVPVLYRGPFSQREIDREVDRLAVFGSRAVPGFMKPEGIIVYHTAARQSFKVTLEHDEAPKGQVQR